MFTLKTFLGLDELIPQAEDLMKKYTFIRLLNSLFTNLSHTFFILFIIDSLGFKQASLITAILLFTQMVFDYPSGSLGDFIGHRWVLTISYIFYCVGYFLLAISETYSNFVIIAVVFGLGHAQASGALQSYLDNNYMRLQSESDPERKNYGFCISRIGSLDNFTIMITFIIGGTLATLSSRQFVFSLQSVIAIILIFFVLSVLQNIDEQDRIQFETKDKVDTGDYSGFIKGGISFIFSSKTAFFFIVGYSIFNLIWTLWSSLMLFPIYYGYTGSDSLAGLLRSSLYVGYVLLSIKAATWTKIVSNNRLPVFIIALTGPLFIGFMMLLYFIPYHDQFNFLACAIIMILMTLFVSLLSPIIWTLNQRVLLDLVPSENRNGIYSLMPTMTNALAILFLPIVGMLIDNKGMISGVIVVFFVAIVAYLFILTAIRAMYPSHAEIRVKRPKTHFVSGR
ncbi:MAG: MFS transporter [Candidatus Kariarchaeaceae archaeon]